MFKLLVHSLLTWTILLFSACGSEKNIESTHELTLVMAPKSARLSVGATKQFTITALGLPSKAVVWNAAFGRIDASGLYTAPTSPCMDKVSVQSVADPSLMDTATVTVVEPTIPGLLSPLRATDYRPNSTFFSDEEDLKLMGKVFNAVLVSNWFVRKQQWEPIQKIVNAKLIPIIYFDTVKFMFRGDLDEIRLRTDEVIAGIKAAPFPISYIKVADELNYGRVEKEELQSINKIVTYLDMTARRLKEAGLVTLVDATSPELYGRRTDRKVYTIAGLDAIIATGYVDGILMGNPGHRHGDKAVIAQWKNARELWPSFPFFSRTASFNFTESTFKESGKNAADLVRWAINIPDSLGSLGWHLWAWCRENPDSSVTHILNADGQTNDAWDALLDKSN